jgi:pimeloyl-ACP methyl ester carboxylesterase
MDAVNGTSAVQLRRRKGIPVVAALFLFALVTVPGGAAAQSAEPPATPPADWGAVSINIEEIEYPHPVQFLQMDLYGQTVRLAYMDVAPVGTPNGRAVVLLHGASYYGWYWEDTIEVLRNEGYRVIVKDRLGWGKSSKPLIPYSWGLHAGNTKALLDHLGIAEAAIVGHSMGGQMASRFAFLYPETTTHLVMVNPIGLTDGRHGDGWDEPQWMDDERDLQQIYESRLRTEVNRVVDWKPEYLEHVRISYGQALSSEYPRLQMVRSLNRTGDTIVHDWPQMTTKAMVIGGEEDGPNFARNASNAAEKLQNAELYLIPNVGHNPHLESPEILNREIIRFLGS